MPPLAAPLDPAPVPDLGYFLRRAEQESIAAIRAGDPRAARQHEELACAYSARALTLLGFAEGR